MTRWIRIVLVASVLGASGCGPGSNAPSVMSTPGEVATASVSPNSSEPNSPLADPSDDRMNQTAPAEFDVLFHTSAGDFTVHVTRDWAPLGADRFYSLVVNKFL